VGDGEYSIAAGFNVEPVLRAIPKVREDSEFPSGDENFSLIKRLGWFQVVDHENNAFSGNVRVTITAAYTPAEISQLGASDHLRLGYYSESSSEWKSVDAGLKATLDQEGGIFSWITDADDFSDPAVGWGAGGGG
jgi:hypothetical protein